MSPGESLHGWVEWKCILLAHLTIKYVRAKEMHFPHINTVYHSSGAVIKKYPVNHGKEIRERGKKRQIRKEK